MIDRVHRDRARHERESEQAVHVGPHLAALQQDEVALAGELADQRPKRLR